MALLLLVVSLLKKMEKDGYLTRRRAEEDDRRVLVSLTEKGRALQLRAKDVPRNVGDCIPLSPEKAQTLYSLLRELLTATKEN